MSFPLCSLLDPPGGADLVDLNWKNPELRRAVFDMMHWWLKKGADGFRMDVVSLS